ncbi:MAG: hypothetical protein Alpg2KO_22790 [Alphaproteobacteria bacterium]
MAEATEQAPERSTGWSFFGSRTPDIGALSREQVQQLHKRAKNRIFAQATKAAGEDGGPLLRMALRRWITKARKARHKLSPSELEATAKCGILAIRREMKELDSKVFGILDHTMIAVASLFRRARPNWSKNLFQDGQDRVYIPFDPKIAGPSDTERRVTSALIREGYKDVDYMAGFCMDAAGKNKMKIGRILKRLGDKEKDPVKKQAAQGLYTAFTQDGSRGDNERYIVISRNPVDVARMSTGRSWESCMTMRDKWGDRGMYWHYVPMEIANNSVVAYMVSKNDPDIQDPLSRVMIRPYRKWGGLSTMLHAGPSYGLNVPGFRLQVQEVLDKTINHDKRGVFGLSFMSYDDNQPRKLVRFGPETPPERVLRALDVPFSRSGGRIIANGNINLSNMGLEELPDFSIVIVNGSFTCKGNRLKSLRGAPYGVRGNHASFDASENRLESAEGFPIEMVGHVDLSKNRLTRLPQMPRQLRGLYVQDNHLTSLEGGPEVVENWYDASNNDLRDGSGFPKKVGFGGLKYTGNPVLEAAIEEQKRREAEAKAQQKSAASAEQGGDGKRIEMPERMPLTGGNGRNPVQRMVDRLRRWI